MVLTNCVARTRGALQPAAPRTMRSRAAGAFDNTLANKIIFANIIIIFVVASVSLFGVWIHKKGSSIIIIILDMIIIIRGSC